ncbi:MAG: terpene cyclase/mutase family protein [Planctomycetes bacterium]|nr:terpene cyclase/mutase family protein [Planctomycetota bacterium]
MNTLRLACLLFASCKALMPAISHADEPILDNSATRLPRPAPTRADEPLAPMLSLQRAGEYLDGAAMAWMRDRQCASCHTSYPFVMARPLLGDRRAPAFVWMRQYLERRVAGWDQNGPGTGLPSEDDEAVSEVVATAATLAFDDGQATGKLHPLTRQALDRMWTLQRDDGSWNWNKHELPPQELDEYFGVVFAALGVSVAPGDYARAPSAQAGLARLKGYLQRNPPPNLHHKLWLLWASLRLEGLLTKAERAQTIAAVLALQRPDGGWNLPSLADWDRLDGTPNVKAADSDGYATGLVLYVLKQAGHTADEAPIARGLLWLQTHQRLSGRWFTRSPNADRAHYITNAGTAYAVMALAAYGITSE